MTRIAIISLILTIATLSNSCSSSVKQRNENEIKIAPNETNKDDTTPLSFEGHWEVGLMGLYIIDGQETVSVRPPSASGPVSQSHYCDISNSCITTHIIRINVLSADSGPFESDPILEGASLTFYWDKEDMTVRTNLYEGKEQIISIYKYTKDSVLLRIKSDFRYSYDPILCFQRIDDSLWKQYSDAKLKVGSPQYNEVISICDDVIKESTYGDGSFTLYNYIF
ncbi:MAG: hypothetical protein IJV32_04295 [Bacteroidales bacterium]|nr:hypothetical protein [Bacteroidales bacterium]